MKRLISQIREFAADLRGLGASAAWHGFRQSSGGNNRIVSLAGIGKLAVRPGNSDFDVLRQVFRSQEYAVPNAAIKQRIDAKYQAIIAAGQQPLIIDAGANIGLASLWFRAAYPAAAITAIEPDAGNAAMLRQNTARLKNIHIMEAAIGASPGFAAIARPRKSWGYRTQRAADGCPIVTIQNAIAAFPAATPFIAKIDIEGFEADLFAQNLDWIDDFFAIYIEPHDWMMPGQHTSANFQKAFGERAFELILAGENLLYVK